MTAAFSIGAVLGLPLVPYINDRYGRKACIVVGSIIITIGAILQTAAVNSEKVESMVSDVGIDHNIFSCYVPGRSNHPRHGNRLCHQRRLSAPV